MRPGRAPSVPGMGASRLRFNIVLGEGGGGRGCGTGPAQPKASAQCRSHANKNFEVEALCKAMPKRLQELVKSKGERLQH